MKTVTAFVLIVLFLMILVLFLIWAAKGIISYFRSETDEWEVRQRSVGGYVLVELRRYSDESIEVGRLNGALPHYEFTDQLEDLKLQAQEKADALNRRLPA